MIYEQLFVLIRVMSAISSGDVGEQRAGVVSGLTLALALTGERAVWLRGRLWTLRHGGLSQG